MRAQFEEKQFEQALNYELVTENRFLFPIGQSLENILGFDAGLFTNNLNFWQLFPENRFFRFLQRYFFLYPEGVELRQEMWELLDEEFDNIEYFPQIKFNLFIQHKRPDYLSQPQASEWPSWGHAYYRYDITHHQQIALERLEHQILNLGIVVYACPAFHTYRELWANKSANTLINNTNFIQVSKLAYHKRFTFDQPGNYGIGFSEPEKIEGFNFRKRIEELSNNQEIVKNRRILNNLSNSIDKIMNEIDVFAEPYNVLLNISSKIEQRNSLRIAFRKISVFLYLTNTTMFTCIGR